MSFKNEPPLLVNNRSEKEDIYDTINSKSHVQIGHIFIIIITFVVHTLL